MRYAFFNDDARSRILAGAARLYKAVSSTMSPKGRNVAIKRSFGFIVTHDGVTVAEAMDIPDTKDTIGYSLGSEIIRNAAQQINSEVGDGTTSVTVLTYCLMVEIDKLIKLNYDAMEIRESLNLMVDELIKNVDTSAITISADEIEKLIDVASVSAGSKEMGKMIGDAAILVGKDGIITVEAGKGYETTFDISSGFQFERGYLSQFFINNKKRMECVLDNPAIIITNEKITTEQELSALFEPFDGKSEKNFVIICDELSGKALSLLVSNVLDKRLNAVAVKAPDFGDNRIDALADIAVFTGGEVATALTAFKAGRAKKVIVSKEKTTIIDGNGETLQIDSYIDELNEQAKTTESKFEQGKIKNRIANLKAKAAIIRVGGATEDEINERKFRIDDAVAATKAAMDGGIVAGCGVAYLMAGLKLKKTSGTDEVVRTMVRRVFEQPFITIMKNASISSEKFIDTVKEDDGKHGFNVMTGEYIDLIKGGIIDPAKVTKSVIKAAMSIAALNGTMDTLIIDFNDKE